MKALIGRKLGMTQIIAKDGVVTPITLIQAGPCTVTQIKTSDSDGYEAIQIGFGDDKRLAKPQVAHAKKANVRPLVVREVRNDDKSLEVALGDSFNVETFDIGDTVTVSGTSKGKGFAGPIKRWNFNRQRKTHGAKGHTRRPGSIGSMYPQKILKGKKMAGRMGADSVTVKNLSVAFVDAETNVLGVTGAIPGPRKSYVFIKETK